MNQDTKQNICLAKLVEKVDNLIETNALEHKILIAQTTKTNGTVSDIVKWKERMTGAFIVVTSIVVPVMLYILYLHIIP